MFVKILVLFLSAVSLTVGQYGPHISEDSFPANILPRRVCGEKLNILMSVACSGVYKKSGPPMASLDHFGFNRPEDTGLEKWFGGSDSEDFASTMPWLGRHNVKLALAGHGRLQKRGIYDECCLDTCTWGKLRKYCGNPDDYNNNNY